MLGERSSARRPAEGAGRALLPRFLERVRAAPGDTAVRSKSRGIWNEATWSDYRDHVERLALGLLGLGAGDGGPVAMLGRPSPGWLYADLAAQSVGALPAPVHATTTQHELTAVLEALKPAVVVLTRGDQLERFLGAEPAGSPVKRVIVGGLDVPTDVDDRVLTFAAVEEIGSERRAAEPDRWESLAAARCPEMPAAIALSAGGSGEGRLAVLTDEQLLRAWEWLGELPRPPGPADRILSSMAMGLVAERALSQLAPIVFGSVVHFPEDELSLSEARREISPTIFFALPQVWEAEASAAAEGLDAAPRARRAAYSVASRGPLARWLAVGPLLGRFGYRHLRLALTGGGRLAPGAGRRWRAWGLDVHSVYGTVETAGCAAVTSGSGRVLAGELSVAADGELLAAGGVASRFDGSAPDVTEDGRVRTGDYGVLDDGLEVLGPKDRRLRLSGGRTVDPVLAEAGLRSSRYVARAVVAGDGWSALGALIEPDLVNLASWARRRGLSFTAPLALLDEPEVIALLEREVEACNCDLAAAGHEGVTAHRVMNAPLQAGVDVTPTGAVRGEAVERRWRPLIEDLGVEVSGGIAAGPGPARNEQTIDDRAVRSART